MQTVHRDTHMVHRNNTVQFLKMELYKGASFIIIKCQVKCHIIVKLITDN